MKVPKVSTLKVFHFVLLCLLELLIFSRRGIATANVSLHPPTVIQAEGVYAQFHCQIHIPYFDVSWSINGTPLSLLPNVTTQGRGHINTLTIPAMAKYNRTAIQCGAFIYDNGYQTVWSSSAYFKIQGPLSSVRNLVVTEDGSLITFHWLTPFTLNLTTTEPDVVYCVNVLRVHNGIKTSLVSNCSVLVTNYTITPSLRECNIDCEDQYYEMTVIPRSNVNGAKNGNATTIVGPKPTDSVCVERIETGLRYSFLNFEFDLSTTTPDMNGGTCDLNISNTDNRLESTVTMCSVAYSHMCKVVGSNCTQELLINRMYEATGYCTHSPEKLNFQLSISFSTHELERVNIRVSNRSISNGTTSVDNESDNMLNIEVTCHYAKGTSESSAVGCFMVGLGRDRATPYLYRAVYREPNVKLNSTFNIMIRGSGVRYTNFYEIEANHFPGKYPALTETLEMTMEENNHSRNMGTVSNLLCVNCNSTTRMCLSVYHRCFYNEQAFPLSVIYTNKHSRHSDSSRTCVTVSQGCYWVAVFGLDLRGKMEDYPIRVEKVQVMEEEYYGSTLGVNNNTSSNFHNQSGTLKILIVALSLTVGIAVTVCTVSMVICLCCKYKNKQEEHASDNFEMETCAAYEVVGYRSQRLQGHYYNNIYMNQ